MFDITYICYDGYRVYLSCYHIAAAQKWFDTHPAYETGYITDPETGEIIYTMAR